jgi:hypothetical protein
MKIETMKDTAQDFQGWFNEVAKLVGALAASTCDDEQPLHPETCQHDPGKAQCLSCRARSLLGC